MKGQARTVISAIGHLFRLVVVRGGVGGKRIDVKGMGFNPNLDKRLFRRL